MASTNSIHRTVRICRWRATVNSLWLLAYCLLALAVHSLLLYRAVSRCKDYNELPWRTDDKPVVELYAYISLIVLSVMCVPFFVITAVFTVGNWAGDGVRLGRDNIHERELAEACRADGADPDGAVDGPGYPDDDDDDPGSRRTAAGGIHKLWRHTGPFSHGFHLVSAFALLLPSLFIEAQEIKYGFRDPDAVWRTDLDWLFGQRPYRSEAAAGDNVRQYTSPESASSDWSADVPDRPPEVGVLPPADIRLRTADVVSPEFINYVAALVFYFVRYAAVFWYTKMAFSVVFLAEMAVVSAHMALSFCGASVLHKLRVNTALFPEFGLALPATAAVCVYLLADCFLLASTVSVFDYGLQQYRRRWRKFVQRHAPSYWRKRKPPADGPLVGYAPHAAASVTLLLVILCRGAVVYDYVIVYRKTGLPVILACIVVDAVYMVSWIALWFALTLKQSWNFRIMFARYVVPDADGDGHVTSANGDAAGRWPEQAGGSASAEESVSASAVARCSSGVLRTSKTKRPASTQRVKFDESENVKSADNKSAKNAPNDAAAADPEGKQPEATTPKEAGSSSSSSVVKDEPSAVDSVCDDYVTESTPENTLTRSYRHSIRDQCGLYFRMSRDVTPKAHSSPIPAEKRQDRLPVEVVIDPLKAARSYAIGQEPSSPAYSPTEGSTGVMPSGRPPNDSGVHLRRLNPAARQDTRYSYPMALTSADGWAYGRAAPPAYTARDGRRARLSMNLDRPRRQDDGVGVEPGPQVAPWSPTAVGADGPPPPPPPRAPRRSHDYDRSYRGRDLKVTPKRADRDSALPSSNETSSNDSNDVLCSQV